MKRSGSVESQKGCGLKAYQWTVQHEQNTFTNTIKDKVGETLTLRNEEGLEVDDGDMERNTTTNGEDEGEKTSEDDVNLLKTISEEQLLKTWIETVGGTKKEKYMGLVLEIVCWQIQIILIVHPLLLRILQIFLLNKYLKHLNFNNFLTACWSNV